MPVEDRLDHAQTVAKQIATMQLEGMLNTAEGLGDTEADREIAVAKLAETFVACAMQGYIMGRIDGGDETYRQDLREWAEKFFGGGGHVSGPAL